jgi:phosphatidylserine/phosphatidylglycerophosphate/cardiolipin synthase-like enzyme
MEKRGHAHRYYFLVFPFLYLLLPSCIPIEKPLTVTQNEQAVIQSPVSSWLEIYFTDPLSPNAYDYRGGPDKILAAAIDQARLSVDVAAYSLNLWSIRDALIHAHQRGVVVRMVMESDNRDDWEVQEMRDAGIKIIGDQQEGLMHNKFIVIDRTEVWTGSMNFTISGAYRDNNNLIHMHSSEIAEDYLSDFEKMFTYGLFGTNLITNIPYPEITINDERVEIYFSPNGGISERIIELINSAKNSIYFLAFSFTSDEIGNALIAHADKGIEVTGVLDDGPVTPNQGTEFNSFLQAGLDVRTDGNTSGLMHHKVIIIDRKIVITGSYNFTGSAEHQNDENVVIIFSTEAAGKYLEEFQCVYNQAH